MTRCAALDAKWEQRLPETLESILSSELLAVVRALRAPAALGCACVQWARHMGNAYVQWARHTGNAYRRARARVPRAGGGGDSAVADTLGGAQGVKPSAVDLPRLTHTVSVLVPEGFNAGGLSKVCRRAHRA